jgi:hypothetical protein
MCSGAERHDEPPARQIEAVVEFAFDNAPIVEQELEHGSADLPLDFVVRHANALRPKA